MISTGADPRSRATHARFSPAGVPARGGFTLVELIIVAVVIAITAAIALPRFGDSVARFRVAAAARRLAADLASAQSSARAMSQTVQVSLRREGYAITASPVAQLAATSVDLSAGPYFAQLQRIDLASGSNIIYDAAGRADNYGTIVVASGPHTRTLTLQRYSGVVVVGSAAYVPPASMGPRS